MKNKNKKELSGVVMLNHKGKEVPVEMIKPEDLKKDSIVRKLFNKFAFPLQGQMKKVKKKIIKEVVAYHNYICRINGVKPEGFENLTLSTYDNCFQVQVKGDTVIDFNEKITFVEKKIKEYLSKKNADPAIRTIVDKIFKLDKKGFVNKNMVLSLFQYNIKDAEWLAAMDLLRESIIEVNKKSYMMLRWRESMDKEWNTLNLNLSSIEVED